MQPRQLAHLPTTLAAHLWTHMQARYQAEPPWKGVQRCGNVAPDGAASRSMCGGLWLQGCLGLTPVYKLSNDHRVAFWPCSLWAGKMPPCRAIVCRLLNNNRLTGSLPATWANRGPIQDLENAVLQDIEYM